MDELQQHAETPAAPETETGVDQQGENQSEQQPSSQDAVTEEKKPDTWPDGTPKWVAKTVSELRMQNRQLAAEREQLAQQLAANKPQEEQQQTYKPEDVMSLAEKIATERLAAQTVIQKSNTVAEKGATEFQDFGEAVTNLNMMGALFTDANKPTALGEAILESDIGHKLLHHIGTHPTEAQRLMAMTPLQQARAIGLLEAKLSAEPAVTKPAVSNAPPPVKPVGSRAPSSNELSESDDIETWMKKRQAQVKRK